MTVRCVLALFVSSVYGQTVHIEPRVKPKPAESATPRGTIRSNTNLVLVPVTVTDFLNRPVVGLDKEHFRLFDNNVEQAISTFSMEDEPVAVGFVLDTSGSMGAGLAMARQAAREFFDTGDQEDEFFLIEFDSQPRLVVPLTKNRQEIEYQLMFSKSHGSTALLDAIYLGLMEMKKSKKTKKALIVISDGGENSSRYSEGELKNILRETDTLIYSVGAGADWAGTGLLNKIAEETGGLLIQAGMSDYSDVAHKIVVDLRNRYVLGYTPSDQQADGRYHRVQVKMAPPPGLNKIRPHWRLGYYAPEY